MRVRAAGPVGPLVPGTAGRSGRIRACGKIRCVLAPFFFPEARIFPQKLRYPSRGHDSRYRRGSCDRSSSQRHRHSPGLVAPAPQNGPCQLCTHPPNPAAHHRGDGAALTGPFAGLFHDRGQFRPNVVHLWRRSWPPPGMSHCQEQHNGQNGPRALLEFPPVPRERTPAAHRAGCCATRLVRVWRWYLQEDRENREGRIVRGAVRFVMSCADGSPSRGGGWVGRVCQWTVFSLMTPRGSVTIAW